MVAGWHNLTRRALLGAAAGVPLAAFASARLDDSYTSFALSSACPEPVEGSKPALSTVEGGCPSCGGKGNAGLRRAQPERLVGPSPSSAPWHRALAAFRRAEARLADFRRYEASLPAAARAFPACEPLEERFGDLESARLSALRRLLRASAPDLAALALKVELAIDNQAWELNGAEPCLAAVKADANRLAAAPENSSV